MTRLSRVLIALGIALGSTLMLVSVSLGGTNNAKSPQVVKPEKKQAETPAKKQAKKLLPVKDYGGY